MNRNLRKVTCECGERLNISNLTGALEPCTVHGFYGGNVTHFGRLDCKCGRRYKGYLRAEDNSYTLIDMERADTQMPKSEENPKKSKKKK